LAGTTAASLAGTASVLAGTASVLASPVDAGST